VLVKELQGLGLKVDLITESAVVDAEAVLAENIKDEAENLSEVDVPAPSVSDVDVSEDNTVDEFVVMELEDDVPATTIVSDDNDDDNDETANVATDDKEEEEA
jgi:hypothetical protein